MFRHGCGGRDGFGQRRGSALDGAGRSAGPYLSIQLFCFGLRPNTEFAFQSLGEGPVLLERRGRPALALVNAHDDAVRPLIQRIQSQEGQGRRRDGIGRAASGKALVKIADDPRYGSLLQVLTLARNPIVEVRRAANREVLKERARV